MDTIITAILAAIAYSLIFYVKKYYKETNPESFDPTKLLATILVGLIVGVAMHFTGDPLSQETLQNQLVAYTGIVAIVETLLKSLYRAIAKVSGKNPAPTTTPPH